MYDIIDFVAEKKMTDYPLCPQCNTELECDDTYDMEYDEEGIVLYLIGHCPKCEKCYQWRRSARCIQWENADLWEC